MLEVVLVNPEIPQNTGNIGRTCVATGSRLHLVRPLGFSLSENQVLRAGLDYWQDLDLVVHDGWAAFWQQHGHRPLFMFTTKGKLRHTEIRWPREAMLVFGPETAGLPAAILRLGENVRLPMRPCYRSLNLSNAVAVAVYECLRQWGFPGLV